MKKSRILVIIFAIVAAALLYYATKVNNKSEPSSKEIKKEEKYAFIESKILQKEANSDSNKIFYVEIKPSDKSGSDNFHKFLMNDFNDRLKIVALFPTDCTSCISTLPHINNLATHYKDIPFIILNQSNVDYKNVFFDNNIYVKNFVSQQNAFNSLIYSIKNNLKLEIRDTKSPLFLIIDKNNNIVKSIEGIATEEMLEYEITQ